MRNKPTAELIALSHEAAEVAIGMIEFCINHGYCMGMDEGIKVFAEDPKNNEPHDFVKELKAFVADEKSIDRLCKIDRLAELEAALETIINMHDGNPSPIANPEPLDYARQVMRDMRLVAKQALQPTSSATQNSHSHSSEATVGPKEAE